MFVAAADGNVHALRASSGELLWSYEAGSVAITAPTVGDGIVYGMTEDGLHALDARTGDLLWLGPGSFRCPTVLDGVVYGSGGRSMGAWDAATGERIWHIWTEGLIRHSPTVAGGMVYWGSDYDHLYAVEASTGELKWSHKISISMYASPVMVDGVVYAITFDGDLYALDASTGELVWQSRILGNVSQILEVVDVLVYVQTNDWHALNATTGELIWSLPQREYGGAHVSYLGTFHREPYFSISDGVVYFSSFAVEATTGRTDLAWPTFLRRSLRPNGVRRHSICRLVRWCRVCAGCG